jgi:hypothetical protein
MPRRLLFLLLFLVLVLAACKPASQAGTATVGTGKTPEATVASTAASTTAPKQAPTLSLPEAPSVAGCTVVGFMPTPDPTSLFPAATEVDHYRGSLTATIKVIEYSDFQ